MCVHKCAGHIHRTLILLLPVLRINPLHHPNNSQWVRFVSTSPKMTNYAEKCSLNLTLVQGYPSRSSETGGLQRDQFVKPAKSHVKWYGLHPNQDRPVGSVSYLHCDSAKLKVIQTHNTGTDFSHYCTGHPQKVGDCCTLIILCL